MGRTNPTFRDRLTRLEDRWQPYRRALRPPAQDRFDRLFEAARGHADAAGYLNHTEPLFPVFLSVLLEQQRQLDALQARVETLEAAVVHRTAATDTVQARLDGRDDRTDGPLD